MSDAGLAMIEGDRRGRHSVTGLRALGCVLVILAIGICFLLNLDPAADGFGYLGSQPVKYAPSVMLIAAVLAFILGGTPTVMRRSPVFWAAVAFCALQIGGAVMTLQIQRVDGAATFIGRGVATTAIFAGMLCGADWRLRDAVLRPIGIVAIMTCWIAVAIAILHGTGVMFADLQQVLHEEHLYICAGLMLWVAMRPLPLANWVAFALISYIAVSGGKATAQLSALVFFVAVFVAPRFVAAVDEMRARRSANPLLVYIMLVAVVAAMVVGIVFVLGLFEAKNLATPNDLRKMLWSLRWDQFTKSPLVGSLFFGSPVVNVALLPGMQIPTHNDILDILAFGGLLGFGLFLALVAPIFWSSEYWNTFRKPNKGRAHQLYPGFVLISYLIVATANPVFANPFLSVPVWFAIGALNGSRMQRKVQPSAVA